MKTCLDIQTFHRAINDSRLEQNTVRAYRTGILLHYVRQYPGGKYTCGQAVAATPFSGLPLNYRRLSPVGFRKKRRLVTPDVAAYLP